MTARQGDFYPTRINLYVPNCSYAADVRMGGNGRISLGPAQVAADVDGIIAARAIATAQDWDVSEFETAYSDDVMGKFGRNILVDGSAAATAVITVYGYDYLGQPMREEITMNGTTEVPGLKAFRRVTRITTETDADATLTVGWSTGLGLPYKLVDAYTELVSGAEPADAGSFTKGSNTATQTATTEPRGLYTPHANNVPDGSRTYEVNGLWDMSNLHGYEQYNG